MPWKDPESASRYRAANREKIARRARERYAENPHSRRAHNLRSLIKQKYGITLDDKHRIFAEQGSRCAICNVEDAPTATGWHIDHCHATNAVRGILCQPCNAMLGNAKDDPGILRKAIAYLEKERK
jgi:hypothetical protein